jgi:hypothetical protein
MSYLQCPQCRLTVPASAYYLRGDECPRCLTGMEQHKGFERRRDRIEGAWSPAVHRSAAAPPAASPGTEA